MDVVLTSQNLFSLEKASNWATNFLKREISENNISYLVQYGKIRKYNTDGQTQVNLYDLRKYYESFIGKREISWKQKLGDDLNWTLSFDNLREKDTTKHVHRLHPYKGKFIPQLVEYFLDNHIDDFKRNAYFKPDDIVLDPFMGSGTTLVQANELGIHAIGIDVSHFNCLISETKLIKPDFDNLAKEIKRIDQEVTNFEVDNNVKLFESELALKLASFNQKRFPSPEYKYRVNQGGINEKIAANEAEQEFLLEYNNLIKKYNIKLKNGLSNGFLDKWYIKSVHEEIDYAFSKIKKINDITIKKILAIILSRTIRSCRATTHSDLATLIEPQLKTYYCFKHKKICKPIFSIKNMFSRYAYDTLYRLKDFDKLRKKTFDAIIPADSRTADISRSINNLNPEFGELLSKNKIKGIFTSPPYVGQIDYHEQHAYAYDLLGFERKDKLEIGPLYKGQGTEAKKSYVYGISDVLINCKKYLVDDYETFLVANDKYNLYPEIAERSGMRIVNKFKRPVLNRTERDKSPYSEIIFHLKEK